MRKKANSIVLTILAAIIVTLPHAPKIVPGGYPFIAATAIAVVVSIPPNCDASVIEQLCSSVTGFLNDEAAKADADLKACKDKCGWKKRKDDLIDAARKKARESCSKGEAPDINDINKGLDGNAKEKLKSLYDNNSRMFDGTAKLASKDFDVKSDQSPALTGKGGQVTDLKTSEPDTPKLNSATEFSLSGTKLSGETSNQATTKQSPVLLASASTAKPPSDTTASKNSALSPQKAVAASDPIIPMVRECKCYYGGLFLEVGEEGIPGSVCEEWKTKNCCPPNQTMAATGCSASCKSGTGFWGFYTNWRHNSAGETANCGSNCFNPETKCCLASKAVGDKCDTTCYDPKTDCCVDGKEQEISSMHCKCQRIEKRIKGVEGNIAAYNQGQKPKDGDSLAQTTCSDVNGIATGTTTYSPAFYDLDPAVQKGVTAHEEIHRQQCETDGWLKWFWRNNFNKSLLEIPAYQREKLILEKAFREQCGK